jgi:hypothetical protein
MIIYSLSFLLYAIYALKRSKLFDNLVSGYELRIYFEESECCLSYLQAISTHLSLLQNLKPAGIKMLNEACKRFLSVRMYQYSSKKVAI